MIQRRLWLDASDDTMLETSDGISLDAPFFCASLGK